MTETRWRDALSRLCARNRVHVGADMSAAFRELAAFYPPSEILGVASGERAGSWVAPRAWEVESARLVGPDGRVLCDWQAQPLSLWCYSPPFRGTVTRAELEAHLVSIPSLPERTAYHFRNMYRHWAPDWGFCLPHSLKESLAEGLYEVDIRTRFEPGRLEMVEQVHQGEIDDSILLVGHFDHPFMALDGLAGCLAGHEAISRLGATKLTWRMLSVVEIIGSVFYCQRWAKERHVKEALFVATSGARAPLQYQTSFSGRSVIDRAMRHILAHARPEAATVPFRKGALGNDEIAFDVAGIDIPCGSFLRGPFIEYHTDADNEAAVCPEHFEEVVAIVLRAIGVIENNAVLERRFDSLPCLSAPELDLYLSGLTISHNTETMNESTRRFLDALSPAARAETVAAYDNVQWLMNVLPAMIDGKATTLDVAETSGLPFEAVDAYTGLWQDKGLLVKRWVHPFQG